jgi:hypothetical protein
MSLHSTYSMHTAHLWYLVRLCRTTDAHAMCCILHADCTPIYCTYSRRLNVATASSQPERPSAMLSHPRSARATISRANAILAPRVRRRRRATATSAPLHTSRPRANLLSRAMCAARTNTALCPSCLCVCCASFHIARAVAADDRALAASLIAQWRLRMSLVADNHTIHCCLRQCQASAQVARASSPSNMATCQNEPGCGG